MSYRSFNLSGATGNLEAIVHESPEPISHVAIVCHPDPLQQGSMDNKVVTTVARALQAMGITAIRFNYRGVGASEGGYGNIDGEIADCLSVVDWVASQWPTATLWLAGFSFGAYIAAKVATQTNARQLITIAPSVERMPYNSLPKVTCPWLVIQGEEDEVVDPQAVYKWYSGLDANKTLMKFPSTGHFFHGKLIELRRAIESLRILPSTKVVD